MRWGRGIELAGEGVFAVELTLKKKGLRIREAETAALPRGAVVNGMIARPEELSTVLRDLAVRLSWRRKPVVTGVGGPNVIIRHLNLPRLPRKEIGRALRWEGERYFPVPVEGLVMDWDVGEGEGELPVLVAAVPREIALAVVETFDRSEVRVTVLDTVSCALARLGKCSPFAREDEVLIVNVGTENTEVVIARSGKVLHARSVAFGSPPGWAEVAPAAPEKGPGAEDGEAIMRAAVGPLLAEIRRSLDYYRTRAPGKTPAAVMVTGPGSWTSLGAMIKEEFRIAREVLWEELLADGSVPAGPEYAAAAGLALRQV